MIYGKITGVKAEYLGKCMNVAFKQSLMIAKDNGQVTVTEYQDESCSTSTGSFTAPLNGQCTSVSFNFEHSHIEAFEFSDSVEYESEKGFLDERIFY
mmetsp:Transcript_26969/g.23854  ORF Transcript_26969/g.23854 Transcript_26969/m.23854 type:complete len:97 (-) Transcript_26969:31-321(-)|eukprot:CAMPEP_0114589222 /NCGR_PEP_ID=MMETSP0125-20121206/11726_1 /TAXON_ID=485358 ORGANISM="Aristerostoma sp., Strain ATCC 50986" /NCGR_SAMPLE_ID=MMETSP0125 /ASSEMBLY_ACC=CAM_ASM_000245 /LENGTH=96 /DNA_ID=CAMNT_0001786005 /DNA_START=455 /DNA_END=745 /DNA_ORIENTATION=-